MNVPIPNAQEEIQVPLTDSRLVIAMAQIEGPLPAGKHLAFVEGRETYFWKSREDVNLRIKKAESILDFLHAAHPQVNIVLFPEYSLPVLLLLERLQQKADDYNI